MSFKHLAVRFAAGALCISTMIAPALAVTGVVNTGADRLNLRAKANTSSAVVTKLRGGAEVEILDYDSRNWYKVSYGKHTGYVSKKFVDLVDELPADKVHKNDRPAVAGSLQLIDVSEKEVEKKVEDKEDKKDKKDQDEVMYGRVTTSKLNVRSGPGTNYEKCGTLNAGKIIEILGTKKGWYRCEDGYVSADYITIVDESDLDASGTAQQVVDLALTYLGYPYVYGAAGPKAFDCSGFTSYVYKQFGYSINRTSGNQLDNGTPVDMDELLPGDLVIFRKPGSTKRATHVGLYIGDNKFVHASTSKVGVIISKLSDAYYTTGFVGGRRIV